MKSIDLTTYDNKLLKIVSFACLLLGSTSFAQENDSIKVTSNEAEQVIKDLNWQLPVATHSLPIKDYTHTGIYFSHKNNQFSRKQTAEETSRYGFLSEGLYTTENGFRIFGMIDLQKFNEKNLSWNLSDERTDEQQVLSPQYFYVPRAADWDNQQYLIRGGVSKNFGNLTLAAKAELNVNKMARKLDPRPEIKNNQLVGEIQVGYELFEGHQIFVLGSYGRKDKDYSLKYKGRNQDVEENSNTYLRYMAGYGREINNPYIDFATKRIAEINGYKELFKAAFGDEKVTNDRITKAIATFERTILSPKNRFDKFISGKSDELTDQEIEGLHLFRTKARCINCHNTAYFSDNKFHNIGLTYYGREYEDLGLYNTTKLAKNVGEFKTPSLREVPQNAPYMHNGLFPTIRGVINMYNAGMFHFQPNEKQKMIHYFRKQQS